jgi:S-(hydroxymethyl)mycothiol dehydrogenase
VTETVRAVISTGGGGPLDVVDIEIPEPGPGDALVRIVACGLCHSDLNLHFGPVDEEAPTILGHEASAVVEAVGEGVVGLAPGDFGIISWRAPCGRCRPCLRGNQDHCVASLTASRPAHLPDGRTLRGFLAIGAFAEKAVISAAQFVKVDPTARPEAVALIGCGVMTGFGAATITGEARRGDVVAVYGCGGVGDAAIAGASLAGARAVIAIDTNPLRLEWAKRFGATHFVNASVQDPVAEIERLTDGAGADVVVDAVGIPQVYEQAFYSHGRTGTLVHVGLPTPTMTVTLPLQELFRRGPIKSSFYGDCLPTRDFPALVDLYLAGKLDLDGFVSETIPLDDLPGAVERLQRGDVLRSVVTF